MYVKQTVPNSVPQWRVQPGPGCSRVASAWGAFLWFLPERDWACTDAVFSVVCRCPNTSWPCPCCDCFPGAAHGVACWASRGSAEAASCTENCICWTKVKLSVRVLTAREVATDSWCFNDTFWKCITQVTQTCSGRLCGWGYLSWGSLNGVLKAYDLRSSEPWGLTSSSFCLEILHRDLHSQFCTPRHKDFPVSVILRLSWSFQNLLYFNCDVEVPSTCCDYH